MPLSKCRECGGEVSDQARSCPHCGAPFPANPVWSGSGFEYKSARTYLGYPLLHISFGRDRYGKRRVAKGIVAIGQFAFGLVTVAQFGVGVIFGFGQFVLGIIVLAQFAVGFVAVGQFAGGYLVIGQMVLAYYGLAQVGFAHFLWSPKRHDPEAMKFFLSCWDYLKNLLK